MCIRDSQCVDKATPTCDPTCEELVDCQCVDKATPACDPNCEELVDCQCVDKATPTCDPTCEQFNPVTCGCDAITPPTCDPNCEELIDCQCVAIELPVCDADCEELIDCQCVPKELPICEGQCMAIVDCKCIPIIGCTILTDEICDGIDNDGDTLIDENYPDNDGDGVADCIDDCPHDPLKITPGICGCNAVDNMQDSDNDGVADCVDVCPLNATKQLSAGRCGCDVDQLLETQDLDKDGIVDCLDACPNNKFQIDNSLCGCDAPSIETIIIHNETVCDPTTRTFQADVSIYFSYPPQGGGISISGDLNTFYEFPPNMLRRDITLRQQTFRADGQAVSLVVAHRGNEACNFAAGNLLVAPSCTNVVIAPTPPTKYPDDCGIHFIAIDNIRTCNDNRTNLKISDDYYHADITVHYTNPPKVGQLEIRGLQEGWVAGAALLSPNTHTFYDCKIPANNQAVALRAIFSGGYDCTYSQDLKGVNLAEDQPCDNCTIMGARVLNISCEQDLIFFDILVTGSKTGNSYTISDVIGNNIGVYNQLASFRTTREAFNNLVIQDRASLECTYSFTIDAATCAVVDSRNQTPRLGIRSEKTVYLYPNPAQNTIQIVLQEIDPAKETIITIYDRMGYTRIVKTMELSTNTYSLDIGELDNGLHFIAVKSGRFIQTGKFIKEDLR